jgi:hypothetical protein
MAQFDERSIERDLPDLVLFMVAAACLGVGALACRHDAQVTNPCRDVV